MNALLRMLRRCNHSPAAVKSGFFVRVRSCSRFVRLIRRFGLQPDFAFEKWIRRTGQTSCCWNRAGFAGTWHQVSRQAAAAWIQSLLPCTPHGQHSRLFRYAAALSAILCAPLFARAADLTWNTGSGTWDVGITANWDPGPATFANGDSVLFTNRGSDATVTVAAGGVQPSQMVVSNNANTFTFTGGPIASPGCIRKTGGGTAVFSTDNTGVSGGIIVADTGTVRFTTGVALGHSGSLLLGPLSPAEISFADFGGDTSGGDMGRVSALSRGGLLLATTPQTANLDFRRFPSLLRLGSTIFGTGGGMLCTGTINPSEGGYSFGGGGGECAIGGILSDGERPAALTVYGSPNTRPNCTVSTIALRSENTFSGPIMIRSRAFLRLGGSSGSAIASPLIAVEKDGLLSLDPGLRVYGWGDDGCVPAGNNTNRLGDSATVSLRGGIFFFIGHSNLGTIEKIGALEVGPGHSVLDLRYRLDDRLYFDYAASTLASMNGFQFTGHSSLTGTQSCELTFGSLTRQAGQGGHLVVRGQNLGSAATAGCTRVKFLTPPDLVGGGGPPGSPLVSIIPCLYSGGYGNAGNSLVTYDANGIRALNTNTEFAALADLVGTASSSNAIVADAANCVYTISSDTAVNSLFIAASGQNTTISSSGGARIILRSGVLMIQIQAPSDGGTWTMSAPVDFNGREGHIYYFGRSFYAVNNTSVYSNTDTNGLTITAVIGTYVGPMPWGGSATFSGPLTINRGSVKTTASEVIPDSSPVRVRSGAQLIIGAGRTETIAGLSGRGVLAFEDASPALVIGSSPSAAGGVVMGGQAILEPADGETPGRLIFSGLGAGGLRLRGGCFRVRIRDPLEYSCISTPAVNVVLSDPANGYPGAGLTLTLDSAPAEGDAYLIVDVAGSTPVSGRFNVPEGNGTRISALYDGVRYGFEILYNTSEGGGDGNDIALRCTGKIPGGTVVFIR